MCTISAFLEKAANSLQPNASISSILSNQNISAGCPVGHCLEESQPSERPFAPVCNLAGSLLPYVAHPSERTFRGSIPALWGHWLLGFGGIELCPQMPCEGPLQLFDALAGDGADFVEL